MSIVDFKDKLVYALIKGMDIDRGIRQQTNEYWLGNSLDNIVDCATENWIWIGQ